MPRRSRKRYPLREVDVSGSIKFEELAHELESTRKPWAEMRPEDRGKESAAKLEAVSRLVPPDLTGRGAAEYYDTTANVQSQALKKLTPDYAQIDYVVVQYVMPEFHRYSAPLPWFFESTIDPAYGSPLTREAIVFGFLEWFYGELVENPDTVPDNDKMASRLVAFANQALSERRAHFEVKKKAAYDAIALAIVRSLTNWGADEDDEDEIYEWISDRKGDLVRPEEYDPLSKPDLRVLIESIAKMLEGNPRAGIGEYTIGNLREIFEPRELVVLEVCARHWQDPDLWPWKEVLRDRHLGLVMSENMLTKTASKVRGKLEERPDLAYSLLDIAPGADW